MSPSTRKPRKPFTASAAALRAALQKQVGQDYQDYKKEKN